MDFYRLLLFIAHVLLRLFVSLHRWFSSLKRTIRHIVGLLVGRRRWHKVFQADSKIMTEIPFHVGLVIAEDHISYDDICKVVVWCLALGIYCISIFDYKGILKKNHSLGVFYKKIEDTHLELTGAEQQISIYHRGVNNSRKNGVANRTSKCFQSSLNGFKSGKKTAKNGDHTLIEIKHKLMDQNDIWKDIVDKKHNGYKPQNAIISIISIEDGLNDIARTAGELCNEVSAWRDPSSISPDIIQDTLHGIKGLPDPELVVRFGHISSTFGYLPWQIRLSEIIPLPTHNQITYEDFRNVLARFCKCEKRFGK